MTRASDTPGDPAVHARTPVRLGILTNPAAHRNHRLPLTHGRLEAHLASAADAVVTADRSRLDAALHQLLVERGVTVLAINGGDGTIHGAINGIVRLLGPDVAAGRARLPTLLFLNGGTYNMASRAFRTKDDPVSTVRRFQQRYAGATLGDLATRRLGLLQVARPGADPMLGMVFGSQVIHHVLDLCDRLGSGYVGLARLLATGVLGSAVRSRFYRENLWRLRPGSAQAEIDGVRQGDVLGVVASTIDMKLVRGLVWALTMPPGAAGFHAKVIRAKTPSEVVHLLPHLLWEIPHHSILAFPEARRLEASGDFTVDGELYAHEGPLTVTASPVSFRALSGDEF
jgi:hypothetical protein